MAVAISLLAGPASYAEGFPGRGNPHDWSAALPYYNLGNKYMQQERYEDAIQKYHEAIGRYEYDPDFFNNLGVALRKIENFEAAEQAFKSAAALNAKDWMSWSNLANSYLKQDRLEDTVKAFEQALKCNPPAQEKEAILKDIADIKKILSVRSGDVQPPAVKTPPAKIVGSGKASKNTSSSKQPAQLKQIGTAKGAPVGAAPAERPSGLVRQNAREAKVPKQNAELNGTGWEEVAK
ncbi:MAG TPA: tetratricopeptide repeat protein [Candidatus Melainabacteria bacterium]|nr:tetratricopeptide repeat protein [Candidatus Melainabacteria bacterium]